MFILAAAICWSSGGAMVKLSAPLNAWQIASIRSFFACLLVTVLVRPWRARPLLPNWKVLLLALINAGMLILYILANTRTTSANAIFLQDTAPVWVSLFSPWLLSEKFRRQDLRSLLICAGGMSLFFVDQLTPGQWTGNLLALGSGVLYALVLIGLRWGRQKTTASAESGAGGEPQLSNAEAILVWGNLLCFLICAPIMGGSPLSVGVRPCLIAAGMGMFQLGLGYYLMSKGIAEVPALEAVLLSMVEPVLNPFWAYLIVGETPGPWALAGGAIILGNVAWQSFSENKSKELTMKDVGTEERAVGSDQEGSMGRKSLSKVE
jgi:DME family drug/metabolite transporter